ncbi:PrsW family intramembrane metalloprotease [Streptomyces triticagri]|uniref:PrsW family intramembrane metalloprotease n=1 Tax=Streptomyces triticagri TaxID=2293568 RepID=A0A372LZ10_9ACTN|nr:PrsW family glutamic-type intramembrane protease [Streptomyces triticagri]RFU83914.1 PrsW family intramembrane metalloprotease [Streptomyces triticagri]
MARKPDPHRSQWDSRRPADPAAAPRRRRRWFLRNRWFRVWLLMLLLSLAFALVAKGTGNTAVVPASFFYGAAAGPVALLVATQDRTGIATSVPALTLMSAGLFGGGVALLLGGFYDALLIGVDDSLEILRVGFIEEPAKLVPVLAMALTGKVISKRAGVMTGLVVATGFAVLESVSYAFSNMHHDNVFAADGVLLMRGLTTPFGHLVWTGAVCAAAFAVWERRGKVVVTPSILGVFVAVCVLHSLNDGLLVMHDVPVAAHLLYLLVALASYLLFRRLTRDLSVDGLPAPQTRTPA